MRAAILLLLILGAVAACALEIRNGDSVLPGLIQKLGDDDFDTREVAERAILAMGNDREDGFAPMLKDEVSKQKDPEIRSRLDHLVQKMNAVGTVGWSVDAGQFYQLPAIYNNRVYIGNKDGRLLCYDATAGKLLWAHENGGFMFKSVAVADGRVILIRTRKDGRPDGRIFALDAMDGRELWSWQDNKKSQYFTAPIVAGGAVYFGREKQLICLDAMEGELRWIVTADNSILAPPAVADGKVLFGMLGGTLQCVAATTGKPLWQTKLDGDVYAGASVTDGSVYTAGGDTVYRFDLRTGAKIWKSPGVGNVGVPLAIKGWSLFAAHGQRLRCLDTRDGTERWEIETGGHIYAAPAAVGERVYVGALNDKLTMLCLDMSKGTVLWSHGTTEAGYAEPIVAGPRLFVGYHSKFYCLRTGISGPANWPMSGGNPNRCGCND